MSYSIVNASPVSIAPNYSYVAGSDGIGGFLGLGKKKKKGKKNKLFGKIAGAVLTGGLSLVIKPKKKKSSPARAVTVPTSRRAPTQTSPTIADQTAALEQRAKQAAKELPAETSFPWIPVAIGVGSVGIIGTIALVATRPHKS
jgi:hypothetical protein